MEENKTVQKLNQPNDTASVSYSRPTVNNQHHQFGLASRNGKLQKTTPMLEPKSGEVSGLDGVQDPLLVSSIEAALLLFLEAYPI